MGINSAERMDLGALTIKTKRLVIRPMELSYAQTVCELSKDDDNRRFLFDEVFETLEIAQNAIRELIAAYEKPGGPYVYAVTLIDGAYIGHLTLVRLYEEWEIGYHTGEPYTGRGYASEAVRAFLPVIMGAIGINTVIGVFRADNEKSRRVLEKCGFILENEFEAIWDGERLPTLAYRFSR